MKIVYLITKSNFGGAQRYVYDLARGVRGLGHDVVVCSGGEGILTQKLKSENIRVRQIAALQRDISFLAEVKSFFALMKILREERPDVLHCNSSKAGLLGGFGGRLINLFRFFLWRPRMRIVFTGHGWAFNEDRNDFERFIIGFAHWLTIFFAHVVIAVSEKTARDVLKLPFIAGRVVVVLHGIEKAELLSREDAQRALGVEEGFCGNALIVGTIAELHKNKGLSYALHGIAQLMRTQAPDMRYIICGGGEELKTLKKEAHDLGIEDIVHFAGFRDGAATLLNAFDVFLLPSITEALGYVLLEAGNAGLPIIATSVGGIPEVIDDMQSGILIQPKNPGEVARALQYIFEHPEKRFALGREMEQRVASQFNIARMIEETVARY